MVGSVNYPAGLGGAASAVVRDSPLGENWPLPSNIILFLLVTTLRIWSSHSSLMPNTEPEMHPLMLAAVVSSFLSGMPDLVLSLSRLSD